MPAAGGTSGRLVVTPEMVPPEPAVWDDVQSMHQAEAVRWDGIHREITRNNNQFGELAQSKGFDEGAHRAGAVIAEEVKTINEWHLRAAHAAGEIATAIRQTAAAQKQRVSEADDEIAAAKLPGQAEVIVAKYHGIALYQTEAGVTSALADHASLQGSPENTRAVSMLGNMGDVATAPPPQPVDSNTSPGITQEDDPYRITSKPELEKAEAPEALADGSGAPAAQAGTGAAADQGPGATTTAAGPVAQAGLPGTAPRQAASPLGGSGMPSMGGMGTGGGGGLPKMPGGLGSGGMPGMGSSPLSGGVGQMPGSGPGLPGAGGLSSSGTGGGSPAATFSQAFSTGQGIGGAMPAAAPPAPSSPSPALTGGAHAAPASAPSGSGMSPAAAGPGMVAPAAPAASAPAGTGVGAGGSAPMMLPPGSMSPPAGPPPPAPTVPAGAVATSGNAQSVSSPPAAAGAGPTLIPASVIAAGQTAAAQDRRESADAAAARELVWTLQHAAQEAQFITEWAVGIFRSPSGTEMVLTSNDGASYIPAGVFVPRSAHVLAADPLVDDHFRQLWFGWSDPARVLLEYAQLRAEWRLVAAATTGSVTALRDAGVEHPPSCTRAENPLLQPGQNVAAPALDDMHEHRLAKLWPEAYLKLTRLADAEPLLQDRIVSKVAAVLMNSATTQAEAVDGGIPDPIRQIWFSRGGDREPSPQQWLGYDTEAKQFNALNSFNRPGRNGEGDPSETIADLAQYRAHWMVARTAELIGGWSSRPLPLPDMCYAAVAAGNVHVRDLIAEAMASVEADLVHD